MELFKRCKGWAGAHEKHRWFQNGSWTEEMPDGAITNPARIEDGNITDGMCPECEAAMRAAAEPAIDIDMLILDVLSEPVFSAVRLALSKDSEIFSGFVGGLREVIEHEGGATQLPFFVNQVVRRFRWENTDFSETFRRPTMGCDAQYRNGKGGLTT